MEIQLPFIYLHFTLIELQCFLRCILLFTCRCAPLSIASSENHEIRTRVRETKLLRGVRSFSLVCTVLTSVPIRSPQLLPNGTMNTAVANRPHRRARRGITYVRVGPGPQPFPLRLHLLLQRRPTAASEAAKSSFFGGSFTMAKTSPLGSSSSSSSSCAEPDKDLALAPVSDPASAEQHAEDEDDEKTQPQRAVSYPENNDVDKPMKPLQRYEDDAVDDEDNSESKRSASLRRKTPTLLAVWRRKSARVRAPPRMLGSKRRKSRRRPRGRPRKSANKQGQLPETVWPKPPRRKLRFASRPRMRRPGARRSRVAGTRNSSLVM